MLRFLGGANVGLAGFIGQATEFFRLLPTRLGRIQEDLALLLDLSVLIIELVLNVSNCRSTVG